MGAQTKSKPDLRRRDRIRLAIGCGLVLSGFAFAGLLFAVPRATIAHLALSYGSVLFGFVVIARSALALSPPVSGAARRDVRRWIYGGIALVLAIVQTYCVIAVIPNRLPSAAVHLWAFPILALAMAIGTLSGSRIGWWVSVLAGGGVLLALMLVIVRILISAAFLAGVYGAFGKAAASFSFVAIALVVEAVALFPLFHVKWLMTRRGRRVYLLA